MTPQNERDEWINKVMSSTSGMARATPGSGVYDTVMETMRAKTGERPNSKGLIRWVAAAIILLAVNAASVIYYTGRESQGKHAGQPNPLATEIESNTSYNY